MSEGLKTSTASIHVANEELYLVTARMTRATAGGVKDIIKFTGSFIASTMREGTMQSVMIPYFGKFKPKKERVYGTWNRKVQEANGANVVTAAIVGKSVKTKKKTK